MVLAVPGRSAVLPLHAGFEGGAFDAITWPNVVHGHIAVDSDLAGGGTQSVQASYDGSGLNGYARTVDTVDWREGDDVRYGASFLLPPGFAAALRGASSILRWDNYGEYRDAADIGGIEIGSSGAARLKFGGYRAAETIGDTFVLPEGRWFRLEVRQRFSRTAEDAVNEVRIDGELVASGAGVNFGRPVCRLRAGIVAIQEGVQTAPLTLHLDDLTIDSTTPGP